MGAVKSFDRMRSAVPSGVEQDINDGVGGRLIEL